MRRYLYTIIVVAAFLSACTSKTEPKNEEQDTAVVEYPGYDNSYDATYPTEQAEPEPSEPTPGMKRCYEAEMDREEDAYEEGRALGEEDRLNGTRSHEGDYDDDDYDEDYDDGYGEEE